MVATMFAANGVTEQVLLVNKPCYWLFLFVLCSQSASATFNPPSAPSSFFKRPLYLGAGGGYGSTTWGGLVPSEDNQNVAINLSTPVAVNEGGTVWGFFTGYEVTPHIALEAAYRHYPIAKITFDEESLFTFEHEGRLFFNTQAETLSLMAKIMLFVPETPIRFFSSFGAAGLHRSDMLFDDWIPTPTFGLGFNCTFNDHIMGEIAANYTAGNGESELNPAEDFVPFLYAVEFRIAYRV